MPMRLPNGYGSVYKLSGKRRKPFAVRITQGWNDDGTPIRMYIGYYASRPEALTALAEYSENPYDLTQKDITYKEVYDKWCKKRYLDKDESIPNPYVAAFSRSEKLHKIPFIDIRTKHIQGEIDRCELGYSTKKNIRILANLLSKYAIVQEIIKTNYAPLTELPPQEASRLHRPFSEKELSILWENTDDPSIRLALIYCYTGLRPTELLKIYTKNVFLDKKYMLGGMKTAAGKNRIIPIADKIFPFIESMHSPDNEFLVIDHRDGKPLASYDRLRDHYWERSKVLVKMDHKPHDGRHTCATLLDNAGVAKRTAQLILGHAGRDITEKVYTHKTVQQLIDAINLI